MSRVNGQVEVDRERIVWELIGKPSVEHAAELWWSGGRSACRKLESAQMRVGRRLLGKQYGSKSGSAGIYRVEDAGRVERRDENFVWLEIGRIKESRLVKMMADKLREDGGIGW